MLQMAACIRLLILAHLASSSYEFSSTNASTSTSSSQCTSIETLKKILLLSSACHLRKTEPLFPTTSTTYEPLSIYTSSPFYSNQRILASLLQIIITNLNKKTQFFKIQYE